MESIIKLAALALNFLLIAFVITAVVSVGPLVLGREPTRAGFLEHVSRYLRDPPNLEGDCLMSRPKATECVSEIAASCPSQSLPSCKFVCGNVSLDTRIPTSIECARFILS